MSSATRVRQPKKVAIVTGSSSGMGQGFAVELARIGYAVSLQGRDTERLQKTRAMCLEAGCSKDEVLIVEGDLSELPVLKKIVENTYSKFGRIDALINNAGYSSYQDDFLAQVDATSYDMSFKVNVRAPIILSRLSVSALKETKGNIVNISTIGVSLQTRVMYTSMKAALEHATATLALELAPEGVRVNALRPGAIWTPLYERAGYTPAQEELLKKILAECFHPVRRRMEQVDINNALRFLLSEDSSFVTGVVLPVTGGGHLYFDGNVDKYMGEFKKLGQSQGTH